MAWRFALMIDPAESDRCPHRFRPTPSPWSTRHAPALNVERAQHAARRRHLRVHRRRRRPRRRRRRRISTASRTPRSCAIFRRRTSSSGVRRSLSRPPHTGPGERRDQADPQPRRRARTRTDSVGDERAAADFTALATRRHPCRHARPRHRQRGAGARAVAAPRREDAVLRREYGGDPRGQAPRRR